MTTLYTKQDKNTATAWLLWIGIFLTGVAPILVHAQARSYEYGKIEINATVNKDTTVDVEERQTFDYHGEYHQGLRGVLLQKIDAITDVSVIDGETGKPLRYSWWQLDKTDPSSWGKFTTYRENGAENIVWYYNLSDTTHVWIIKYKVHGGLAFYKDHDEFYWNLFTDYSVPVREVYATVRLPQPVVDRGLLTQALYSNKPDATSGILDNQTFFFQAKNFSPKETPTIAAGWPKGIVNQGAYWRDFLWIYFWVIFGALAVVLSILYSVIRWYLLERRPLGSRTIVPEYEPPQNLPPAEMGVILHEGVAKTTWPATIIDLAVRGYVRIEAERRLSSVISGMLTVFLGGGIVLIGIVYTFSRDSLSPLTAVVSFFLVILVLLFLVINTVPVLNRVRNLTGPTDYTIIREHSEEPKEPLGGYQQAFFDSLFAGNDRFSTYEMRKVENQSRARTLYLKIQKLQKDLDSETERTTRAYAQGFGLERKRATILRILLFVVLFSVWVSAFFKANMSFLFSSTTLAIALFIVAGLMVWSANKDARLNAEGDELKRQILGFKLYLETAEKYRMQNLTPETFEKYLPYAIIFGVEKKWAKAFEGVTMAPPSWYRGAGATGAGVFSGNTSSFSPTAFTSAFSASFASSFSSSGGGGASGGGGSAGGGGGGGGGGAS